MKGNARKCHLLLSSGKNVHVNIGASQIKNNGCKRLLYIDIDCKTNFENHIKQICTNAIAKIKGLTRRAPFLNKEKTKLLMNAFVKSQLAHYHVS